MNNNKTSFWKLLTEQAICIPIIQRDYAQGREGKEYLRHKFLNEIFNALNAEYPSGFLTLDFVYGAESDTVIFPLDGQQRLTTLWLIHWYLAFHLGLLMTESGTSEIGKILQRFSYETRVSSREFCMQLCQLRQPSKEEKESEAYSLLKYIRCQTWFYTAWNQDPTIQAMLRMLCGTDIKDDKTKKDITDGIDEFLAGYTEEKLLSYWNKLTSSEFCPISFYKLAIGSEQLPMSDELYIKMNARGKALTDFENLKADFVDWIYQDDNAGLFADEDINLNEKRAMYASLLDNSWMDVFWDQRTPAGKVDEIYYTFFNRYFINEAILLSENASKAQETHAWKLYGDKSDDSKLAYTGFEIYDNILKSSENILYRLGNLFKNLSSHQYDININLPKWIGNKSNIFNFIPVYEKDVQSNKLITIKNEADRIINKISTLTQEQRVLFLAITKYFEKRDFDKLTFSRWMRVSCNLIENTEISTIEDMIGRMKLINELSNHIDDIYGFLAYEWDKIKSNASSEQLWEEHEKCLKILDKSNNDTVNWEHLIIEMENYAFFNGAIRFLFINENELVDWSTFQIKSKFASIIFNEKGLTETYRHNAKANRIILSYCNNWMSQIQSWTGNNKYIFSYNTSTWRNNILLKKGENGNTLLYSCPIHNLLTGKDINFQTESSLIDPDDYRQVAFKRLVTTNVIEKVLNWKDTGKYYVRWTYDNLCLYPSCEGVILTLLNRDNVLYELLSNHHVSLDWDRNLATEISPMFIGWEIFFYYNYNAEIYQFQWAHWNTIYMCKNNRRLGDIDPIYKKDDFTIDGNLKCDEILARMNSCIDKYIKINTSDI